LESKILIEVVLMIFICILFGRIAKLLKMPNVTGYLLAGLILGPSFSNLIPSSMLNGFKVVSDIALAFIAFSIGSEFNLSYFKKVGIAPIIIAIAESIGAVILVSVTLIIFGFDLKLSLLLGAIAAATAPAQTIIVINQYKAKGSLTSMLMSVVAIDDAVALIVFGFAVTTVKLLDSSLDASIVLAILRPIYEVGISLIIGALLAIFMKVVFRWFKKPSNVLCITIGFVLFAYWLAEFIHASPLLSCMALGGMLTNIYSGTDKVMNISEAFTPPIFMIFFAISGAGFELSALPNIGLIGLIYVVMRVIGKILGSWLGGKATKQDEKICKYLGPTLMPQAGVALGLIVVAESLIPTYAPQIRAVILCSTFIYSIIGPVAAKLALEKAGEIVIAKKQHSIKC
jgi:Kef-type K+ transport system membrane component KefB